MMLFRHLGVDTYVLADEPLNKLIAHLQIDQHLDEILLIERTELTLLEKPWRISSSKAYRLQRYLEGWGLIAPPFIAGSEHGRIAD